MGHNYFDGDSIDFISHIELSNNYNIGMVSYNDSLNIYDKTQTFKLFKATKNTSYRLKIIRHNSVIEFLQPHYSLSVDNSYDEILIGLVHQINKFNLDLEIIKFSSVNGISPSLSISYIPFPWLIILTGKTIKKPLSLKMNYLDFIYTIDNNYIDNESFIYGLSIISKTKKIKYLIENGKWSIPSTDFISSDNGTNKYSELSGSFYFNNDRRLNWKYNTAFSSGSINFRNNSKLSFFKINDYTFENTNVSIGYNFSFLRLRVNTEFRLKKFNFYLSNRIRPTRIIPDLFNNIFGLYLDSKNIGELSSKSISFELYSQKNRLFSPYMKIDWLDDSYDVNLDISIRQIIPYLEYNINQDLAIIGKKALNLGFGYEISYFNNWLISLLFSQHIPYEISLEKKDDDSDSDSIDDIIDEIPNAESIISDLERTLTNNGNYGGGLFQLTIRKYLD